MSRQDSSVGIFNYTQIISGTSATPLLAPTAAGVNPGFPSPLFPLSTATYPVGVFVGVPPDVAGGEFDSHPFEVQLTAKVTSTTTTNVLVSLFQATAASWKDGPYAGTYTLGTLGSGCTNVATGTATSGLTSSAGVDLWFKAQFVWSSSTKALRFGTAAQYINGSVVSISATSGATSIGSTDLNFIPQFTFASGGINTVNVVEFVIQKL
jgi:hypothetical protein